MTTHGSCAICQMIRSGRADGRVELWRTDDCIVYLVRPDADSVEQVGVAPFRHAETLLELTAAEFEAVFLQARDAAIALDRVLDPDGVTLHQHTGSIERQLVPHVELLLGARIFGSEWWERAPEWSQEPWVLTEAIAAQWAENIEERLATAHAIRAALARTV